MPEKKKKYQFKFPGQSDNLQIIRDTVSRIARKAGFAEDDVSKIELAVDEACANVIKHAFTEMPARPIELEMIVEPQKLTIVVADKGRGFDVARLKKPNMDEYLSSMRVGGLGIYLIHTLMDEVKYDSSPGKGTTVTMVKFISNDSRHEAKQNKTS